MKRTRRRYSVKLTVTSEDGRKHVYFPIEITASRRLASSCCGTLRRFLASVQDHVSASVEVKEEPTMEEPTTAAWRGT